MDIFSLKVFLGAAKSLNFTKVAEDFYTTQPAISRRISELERELGYKLFNRGNHGVTLTKEGEILVPFVRESMDTLALGITTVNDIMNIKKHKITIVSMMPMTSTFLPAIIWEYTEKNPQIEFESIRMFSRQIRESLSYGGESDIYIGEESDIDVDETWEKTIIKSDPLGLIVRQDEKLDSPEEIRNFILTHHAFMLPKEDAPALVSLSKKILTLYGSKQSSWIETSPVESVMFNISSGMGYTFLPKNALLLKAFDLKLIPLGVDEQMNMVIAHRKNAPVHVKRFSELVIKYVADRQGKYSESK